MVTWGEARLVKQGTGNHPDIPEDAAAVSGISEAEQEARRGVPFTFTFVGDAKRWREEISIQTEKADFLMRDTRLLWTDGQKEWEPYPDPLDQRRARHTGYRICRGAAWRDAGGFRAAHGLARVEFHAGGACLSAVG